ncbi:unnamed protein product [Rodentolepis nana]|uniref:CULLIN_2 domain-containing protein n=1 Tax=Rodentolepis nana TaxID=102285 RepID=A0A0R3T563_RODNA|nr:unnamed protein product [Rodentolepis nana]
MVLKFFMRHLGFYLNKHTGRKISLHSNLGHAELSATFNGPIPGAISDEVPTSSPLEASPSSSVIAASNRFSSTTSSGLPGSPGVSDVTPLRKYILMVSTFQMVILMLFNQRSRYTFSELMVESGIPERDLLRNLMALCMSKSTQRILCKEPKPTAANKEIEPTDVFYVNNSFFSRLHKVKNLSVRETEPERQETRTKVDENRRYVIEATIVRIMKARKTMEHNQLLSEVMEQLKLRFRPTSTDIKQRIEALINREFIARSENDHKVYNYIA